jgi:protein ImuA
MDRLYLLRASKNDLPWSAIECLRCRQIGAVIVVLTTRPTRVEVRRLQLAAEHGGGVGILLRPNQVRAGSQIYAAASRWLVSPAPSEASSDPSGKAPPQRWRIERIHGHGRHFAESFIVEKPRALG